MVSKSTLVSRITEGKYSKSSKLFRKVITINEFNLSNSKKTGHGSFTVVGFDENNKEKFRSNGIIHINFVNATVELHENINSPYDNNGNYLALNSSYINEMASGQLLQNGELVESYVQTHSNGDIYSEIVEYSVANN